jgi:hypothetical protein
LVGDLKLVLLGLIPFGLFLVPIVTGLLDEAHHVLSHPLHDGVVPHLQLAYEELTRSSFTDISLPSEFIGQKIKTVPVSGTIFYTVLLYDENELFELLRKELDQTVSDQKVLILSSIRKENLVLHVIDAPWDEPILNWVKVTVDLSGTERYVLDPLTPTGAIFSKRIRDAVSGKTKEDAERIVKNFPEVAKVAVSIWPFWNRTLPSIASNISIRQEER